MSRPYDYGQAKQTPGDFIIPFGKYKGQQLRNIKDLKTLDHYLKWDQLRDNAREAISAWLRIPTNRRDLELQLEGESP